MVRIPAPKTLKVGGRPYTIVVEPNLGNRRGVDGLHSPQTLEIILDEKPLKILQTETLLHEWMEAVNIVSFNGGLDHDVLDRISQSALQLFGELGIEIDW